jgi:hypothetical protein
MSGFKIIIFAILQDTITWINAKWKDDILENLASKVITLFVWWSVNHKERCPILGGGPPFSTFSSIQ